ncbi:MAG: NAD(P)/FAD-dependent oxidoreductase, partial [Candidatus Thermoplasmatota archaeon]
MDYDVVIVGGGPTGGIVGEAVAKNGYKVCIFEEHREIGKPLQCAGLVSKNLLKEFQFKKNIILNSFNGANFSIGEKKLRIEAKENKAYVIDRPMLDREIITNSIRAGCDIFLGKRVEGIKK